jgi:hypothetical protein
MEESAPSNPNPSRPSTALARSLHVNPWQGSTRGSLWKKMLTFGVQSKRNYIRRSRSVVGQTKKFTS